MNPALSRVDRLVACLRVRCGIEHPYRRCTITSVVLFCALFLAAARPALAVTIDWLPVRDAGNANDPATGNVYGGVAYNYSIAKYDVTFAQYAEFLNTKDPTGANLLGLWNINMADAFWGGISFNGGNVNGSKYVLTAGHQNYPVNEETWYSAIRFANWLNNGQGSGDTETGAYTLGTLGAGGIPTDGNSIVRNPGATVVLPSENEWYKAAYYNPATSSYFLYGTSSDTTPIASGPTALANHANFDKVLYAPTDVGAYSGTTSPYGAFDMNGNVLQWNETLTGFGRDARGGYFASYYGGLASWGNLFDQNPTNESGALGFRVASLTVPEPSGLVLAGMGLISLAGMRIRRARAGIVIGAILITVAIPARAADAAPIHYSVDWTVGAFTNGDPLGLAGAHMHMDALVDPAMSTPIVGPGYTQWFRNDLGGIAGVVQVTITGSSHADGTLSGFSYEWDFYNDSGYSAPLFQVAPPADLVQEGSIEFWPGGYDVTIGGLVFALPASFNTPAPDGTILPYPFESSDLVAQWLYMYYDFNAGDGSEIISEAHAYNISAHAEVVPEPDGFVLAGMGLLGLVCAVASLRRSRQTFAKGVR
jgi:sulfatase modifying factor 1